MANKKTTAVLIKEGYKAASDVHKKVDPAANSKLPKATKSMTEMLSSMKQGDIELLRVALGGAGRILDAKVDTEPQPACGCTALLEPGEPSSLRLSFDYLNPGDGFSVRLLHTASEPTVKVVGALKGAQRR